MEVFLYITLNLVLLFTFFVVGKNAARTTHYFKAVFPAVLLFVLIQGSRYNRGNDYLHYVDVYLYDLEPGQRAFTLFNDLLKSFDIGPFGFYYVYALVFIFCAFFFLKDYRKNASLIFPLFLMSFLMFHEFMIRQALGVSFVFIYFSALSKVGFCKKIKDIFSKRMLPSIIVCFCSALLAFSIHSANIIVIFLATIFYFCCRVTIPLIISIPGIILANYVLQYTFDFSLLEIPLSYLSSTDEKMAVYADNADKWFSSSGFNAAYTRNPIVLVFEIYGCISLFYFGKKALSCARYYALSNTFYNMFVVGYICQGIFRQLELLSRMCFAISRFWFVPLSLVLINYNKIVKKWYEKILFLGLLFWGYEYFKFIFYREHTPLFLWDKFF